MQLSVKRLESILEGCKGRRVAVVGDLMLDVYLFGSASRLSPEAPVPVVNIKKKSFKLGGAANVMRNVVSLGGKVSAFGAIGDDQNGETLKKLLAEDGIDASCVIKDPSRRTTEKQRLLAGNQQLVRMDFEDCHPVPQEVIGSIYDGLEKLIASRSVDAIIFEDYAKGLLDKKLTQAIVDKAAAAGVATGLDPHLGNPMQIKKLSLLKPNRSESFGLAGVYCHDPISPVEKDVNLMEVARRILENWEPERLLITLGSQGMGLFGRDELISIPTNAKEVFDVSGAGDTVIASYMLSLAAGASPAEAAELSNHAAGIVVAKVGTATASPEEILESLKDLLAKRK